MKNTMIIKKDFSVIDYVSLVTSIEDGFFDAENEYQPHIGRLNVMRLFYNKCVKESKFDLPHDFNDALMLEPLIQDEKFIEEFNRALIGDGSIRLDFANAYAEAMEIVNTRKSSLGNVASAVRSSVKKLSDTIASVVTDENMEKLSKIAAGVTAGNLSLESFINAYANSQSPYIKSV